jgi:hypothetical protein
MSGFLLSVDPLLATPIWPVTIVPHLFRPRALAFGLLLLGVLPACQSPNSSAAQANPTIPTRPVTKASDPTAAPATIPSFTLSIDGQTEPVQECTLAPAPRTLNNNYGFVFGFTGPQAHVEIFGPGAPNVRITVGKYPIFDTNSPVVLTAGLPPRFNAEREDPALTGYFSDLGADESHGASFVHDWGEGLQKLRGRKLGEVVFTRVSDNTADGSFQSYVYSNSFSHVEYEGRLQVLVRHKGHLLKGTFKNLPYGDIGKAMDDLQEALKATEGLRTIITRE